MRLAVLLLVLFFVAPCFSQASDQGTRGFGPEDWAALRSAHAVSVAPDGKTILYKVNHGAEQGPTQNEWWLLNQGRPGGRTKLEMPKDFSPSGFLLTGECLYGTWQVNGTGQFAVFDLHDLSSHSVPRIVVLLPRGVKSVSPSPDGSRFALTYDPRPPDARAEVRTVLEPDSTGIYVLRADGTKGGNWCDTLNRVSDVAWSQDGQSLAVLSATSKIGFHTVTSFIDVCTQAGSHRLLERPAPIASIAWDDAGKSLDFLSTTTHVLTPDHVWTIPVAGGLATDRTPELAGSAIQLSADPEGSVWVSMQRGLQKEIDRFQHGALRPAYEWPSGNVELPVFSPYAGLHATLAFTVNDLRHAPNVAVAAAGVLQKVTNESDDTLNALALADARIVHWTSKDGTALEGLGTFPPGYTPGRRYPLLVIPHGGPEANDTLAFDSLSQIFANRGYVVFQPEYRGSTGYGSTFLEAIYQHFGDRAYEDVDSATTFAVAQGWADPKRLAIFGWSAGGFMTAWTVTQTGRYKAAIEGAGITEWSSFIETSDLVQTDFDERWPSESPEAFRRFSAIDFAEHVTTPLLILHGAADARVPTYQGIELFQTLAARGKTVSMVTYPGSPHFPVLWQQRLDLVNEVCDWLAKYNP